MFTVHCIRVFAVVAIGSLILGCTKDIPVSPLRTALPDLPADLAAIKLTTEGQTTAAYTVLELGSPGGFNGFVIINSNGQPVWFFRTTGSPSGFVRRGNGDFVFLDTGAGLLEVTPAQSVVHSLPQQLKPGRGMHHDLALSNDNTILFLAHEWRAHRDTLINGAAIWEWNPEAGSETKRWSSFEQLDTSLDRGSRSIDEDWLHENSLSLGPTGNIIISFHFLNQILSLSPDFQKIQWRLGGTRRTIAVTDSFSGEHTAQEIAPNHVLMFDNGYERVTQKYSRAAEYEISGSSANVVWQWRPEQDNWARVIGGARRLSNGNTFVTFGVPKDQPPGSTGPIEAYEVTPAGKVVWHLTVSGTVSFMYRATPLYDF